EHVAVQDLARRALGDAGASLVGDVAGYGLTVDPAERAEHPPVNLVNVLAHEVDHAVRRAVLYADLNAREAVARASLPERISLDGHAVVSLVGYGDGRHRIRGRVRPPRNRLAVLVGQLGERLASRRDRGRDGRDPALEVERLCRPEVEGYRHDTVALVASLGLTCTIE